MLQERYEKVMWMTSPVYYVFKSKPLKIILNYLDHRDLYNFRKAAESAVWFNQQDRLNFKYNKQAEQRDQEFQAKKIMYANRRFGGFMM